MRKQLGLLALLFLIAHLPFLPPTLEDVDSVNFALGVRDFDVAKHQPHPPGYPVFIALGKMSTAALRIAGLSNAETRGLSLWSVLSGAVLIALLFALYRSVAEDVAVAWWAMALAVCSPLFWFTALRPLSDMTGLAFAVAAQACLVWTLRGGGGVGFGRSGKSHTPQAAPGAVGSASDARGASDVAGVDPSVPVVASAFRRKDHLSADRLLIAGAFLTGLGAGLRAQTVMLTAPLLVAVLAWPRLRIGVRARLIAIVAAAAGALVWTIPLLMASGGLSDYAAALGTQAGEDFSGVVMLWTTREARVVVNAIFYSFFWPWAIFELGIAVTVIAAFGVVRVAWRAPATAAVLLIAFAPYAVFHLLFHETATVRYALPLILPVAFLAAYAARATGRVGLAIAAVSIAVASLATALPAAREYARSGSPAFRLFERVTGTAARGPDSGSGRGVIAMHAVMKRVEEWHRGVHGVRVIQARHGQEWLALVEHWRQEPDTSVRFFADPRRTDLALFDAHARRLTDSERWTFAELPFVSGTRPGPADAYTLKPPGWMLDRGWALTAEVGGVTAKAGLGPHVQPSVAWVRSRPEEASLIVGGRNLGTGGDPAARLTLHGRDGVVDSWTAAPGFFFRHVLLRAGSLAGAGYVPLRLSAVAADDSGRQVRVSLEQFDLQSPGATMLGYLDGWQEPEYNPATARSWRWMSERARLLVKPVDRDLTLTITGESPLRYFDRAPTVRVVVAGVEIARFSPTSDFSHDVLVPAKALRLSGGVAVLESDIWFTPADRGEPDQRHLALRIYSIRVR